MTGRFICLGAAAVLMALCGGHAATAAPGTDAEQATASLRAIYQGPDPYGVFKSRDRTVLGKLLTPALVETWAGPEADGPQSDGSPLTWHQMTDSARLVAVEPRGFTGDRGTLEATVDSVIEDRHVTERIAWDMEKVEGRWLADDSHYAGSGFRAVFAGFAPAKAPVPAAQAAPDKLPLRHGIFVLRDVPCQERSNATVQSFWGDSLNTSHETGSILSAVHRRNVYDVRFAFQDIDGGPRIVAQHTIVIRSSVAYSDSGPDGRRTDMRWCAAAM